MWLSFSDRLKDIAVVSSFLGRILKIGPPTFIHRTGIPTRIEDHKANVKKLNGGVEIWSAYV